MKGCVFIKKFSFSLFLITFIFILSPVNTFANTDPKEIDSIDLPKLTEEEFERFEKQLDELDVTIFEDVELENNKNNFSTSANHPFDSISIVGEELPYINKMGLPDFNYDKTEEFVTPFNAQRDRINNTNINPYNRTVRIQILTDSNQASSCSGFFATQNHVVTAAHCVYDAYNDRFNQAFLVLPAQNGTNYPYAPLPVTNAWITSGYANTSPSSPGMISLGDVTYDFAVLRVDGNHPHNLNVTSTNNQGATINAIGYPGDGTELVNGYPAWFMFRNLA
ncbi:hypothetical protein JCM19046_3568 [Bacillus sp. JCM 19046]|nr:hypothetical protein JCM19046_3568 [Bacillus sp. JCM 19046]